MVGCPTFAYPSVYPTRKAWGSGHQLVCLSLWTVSSSMKTNCVADRRNSEFWQRIGQPYVHANQGDVLLLLSTLKRIVCSAVPTVADVVRLRGTAIKLSATRRLSGRVGGQATNNLPTMEHHKQNCFTRNIVINQI